jgi:hypothetical protein
MRLACGLAIALGLSFTAAGTASGRPDPATRAQSTGQAPAAPVPSETAPSAPANPETATGEKTPESSVKEKTGAAKASTAAAARSRKHRKRPPPASAGAPRKIVVREGGASEPTAQIVPGMTPADAARQRQNAEQLLKSTDDQLKQLAGRTLDAQRQETLGQIQNYMNGVHLALKDGDVRRASTLAEKAHLLSEDLVKQKH